jgi:hypothetical protein
VEPALEKALHILIERIKEGMDKKQKLSDLIRVKLPLSFLFGSGLSD